MWIVIGVVAFVIASLRLLQISKHRFVDGIGSAQKRLKQPAASHHRLQLL